MKKQISKALDKLNNILTELEFAELSKLHLNNVIEKSSQLFKTRINNILLNLTMKDDIPEGINIVSTLLTEESYRHFTEELKKVIYNIEKTSIFERKTQDKSKLRQAVFNLSNVYLDPDDPALDELGNVFGKIKNL